MQTVLWMGGVTPAHLIGADMEEYQERLMFIASLDTFEKLVKYCATRMITENGESLHFVKKGGKAVVVHHAKYCMVEPTSIFVLDENEQTKFMDEFHFVANRLMHTLDPETWVDGYFWTHILEFSVT